jgi:DNA polymerase III epsilon subunit family exonuclease
MSDVGRALVQTTFVVIDLETTGGTPHLGAAITEIGAVKVCGGEILGEFKTFVNPGHSVPGHITALTGITDSMVYQAPSIAELLPSLFEFIGPANQSVLVAQNAPFDLAFLSHATRATGRSWPNFVVLDTAIIARKLLTRDEVPNCKLATLASFFGTATTPNHRALDDARATLDVFHGLLERLGTLEISTLDELITFGRRSRKRSAPELNGPTSLTK